MSKITLNLLTEKNKNRAKKNLMHGATKQLGLSCCMDSGNIKLPKMVPFSDLQCTFLLLARWGKEPRMLCALRSCLVRIPTIGEI